MPAGASTPKVELTSSKGMPLSAAEGTSGSIEMRLGAATASARNWPALMNGCAAGTVSTIMLTCPATRSVMAGPLPLYGTWVMSILASFLKISAAMRCGAPAPEEA
ncbi:hypothetical protein D3C72_1987360 [compost metagenome]